jgi:glycosyltransferase involved in cell wall biosynthesis
MEYLVRASKLLSDDYVIYVAGQGPLTDKLKNLASGDQKLIFVGKISDEELKAYYLASDIFCFPSITKNEAFGISLAEGMYFEKPSVTFTIPESGVNFVSIGGLTGIEVENSNYVEYAKAIEKLANDKELRGRYAKSARERVDELFTEEKFKQSILGVIEELK